MEFPNFYYCFQYYGFYLITFCDYLQLCEFEITIKIRFLVPQNYSKNVRGRSVRERNAAGTKRKGKYRPCPLFVTVHKVSG
jgi:hypothetical protein